MLAAASPESRCASAGSDFGDFDGGSGDAAERRGDSQDLSALQRTDTGDRTHSELGTGCC